MLSHASGKQHFETAHTKVPWTFSKDGTVKSGDCVMLKNKKTNGWLVFNTADRVQGTVDECYMLTTTTDAPGPVKRSVF